MLKKKKFVPVQLGVNKYERWIPLGALILSLLMILAASLIGK
jgi:hypothetical protein